MATLTTIEYDRDAYQIVNDEGCPFLALYWRYGSRWADEHDSARAAFYALYVGDEEGALAAVAILNRGTGEVLYQDTYPDKHGYFASIDDAYAVADRFDAIDI